MTANDAEPASDLNCPRCNLPLKRVRTGNRIMWACDACGGRAVGLELLRRTFSPESINPLWLHAIQSEGGPGGQCPSCRNPMIEVGLADAAVRVDVCRLCHFVWFDVREVETLVPRTVPASEPELAPEARQAIAMIKVKELAEEARRPDFGGATAADVWKKIASVLVMPVH